MGTTTEFNRWTSEDHRARVGQARKMLLEATDHLGELEAAATAPADADRRFLQARALVAAALHELRRLGPAVG